LDDADVLVFFTKSSENNQKIIFNLKSKV